MRGRGRSLLVACVLGMSGAVTLGAGAAYADPGVTPSTVTLNLPPGGSTTVAKTVETPPIPPNPDIVFLVDTTTSMGPVISNVQANAPAILSGVASAQPSAEFAVAEYKDAADGPAAFTVLQNLTPSQAATQAGLSNLTPLSGGGSDAAEDAINALYQSASGAIAFRPGSARVIVWIGDSSSHDPSLGHPLGQAGTALQSAGVRVLALDVGPTPGEISDGLNATGQASFITALTGGQLFSGVQPGQVSSTILAGLHNLPVTVGYTLVNCDSHLSVSQSPSSQTVTSGANANFSESIHVAADAVPGSTITCTVRFTLNGSTSAGFDETITENVPKAAPSLGTTPSGSVPAGGLISDTATLSGAYNPTGSVTFRLYGPGDTSCSNPIATRTAAVSGISANSGAIASGGTGTYRWTAQYSGDAHNNSASSGCGAELVVVTKASPGITTTPSGSVPAGGLVHDSATLLGGYQPTGTVTFRLYAPNDTTCADVIASRTVVVSGAGTAASGDVAVGGVGIYNWVATYSGDANNNGVAGACGDEPVEIVKASPAISTTPSGTVPAGGLVHDSATVTGGYQPTGTVTFRLYGPGDTTCSGPLGTRTVPLSGSGTAASGDLFVGPAGTYNWVATYNGDANNNPVAGTCGDESVLITPQVLTGRAFGVSAAVTLLGAPLLTLARTPDTGAVTTTSTTVSNVPCTVSLTGLVTAHALCASVETNAFPGRSTARASIDDTAIGIPGLPVVTLKAVQTTSTTTCAGSSGSTTIAYLKVGNVVVIGQPTAIPPNTTVNVGVVKLVLNEQRSFSTPDDGLTVNAVHLTVNVLGLAKTDVVLASSESDIGNCP